MVTVPGPWIALVHCEPSKTDLGTASPLERVYEWRQAEEYVNSVTKAERRFAANTVHGDDLAVSQYIWDAEPMGQPT